MNAFELLKKDHENVSALFKQIEAASETNKTGLFARLKNELDVHAHIEETIFYPVLEATAETREITLEAYEEHNVVKDLLAELESYGTPDDEWDAKLTVLKENVEHHVEEEEGEMFDKAADVLSQDQIEQLGDQMAAEKQQLMGETSGAGGAAKSRRVGQSRATTAGSKRETGDGRTGIIGTLANLVGLGSSSAKDRKTRSRKTSSGKSATKSTASRKRQATKSTTSKRTRTSKRAAKRSTKTTAKRVTKKSAASRGSKRAALSSRTSALKTSRSAGTKKRTSTKKSSTKKKSRKK
jgi:hypothetical protein